MDAANTDLGTRLKAGHNVSIAAMKHSDEITKDNNITQARRTSPHDPHQGSGSRVRRASDVSNKTTQILANNPDQRTVAHSISMSSTFRPCTHPCRPLKKVSQGLHHHPSGPAFSPQYATLQRGQEWNWLGSWTGRRGVHLASGCFADTKHGGDI